MRRKILATVQVRPLRQFSSLDFPLPETEKALTQFIGPVNYFRDHVPHITEMIQPLWKLIDIFMSMSLHWGWTISVMCGTCSWQLLPRPDRSEMLHCPGQLLWALHDRDGSTSVKTYWQKDVNKFAQRLNHLCNVRYMIAKIIHWSNEL